MSRDDIEKKAQPEEIVTFDDVLAGNGLTRADLHSSTLEGAPPATTPSETLRQALDGLFDGAVAGLGGVRAAELFNIVRAALASGPSDSPSTHSLADRGSVESAVSPAPNACSACGKPALPNRGHCSDACFKSSLVRDA